MPEKILQAIRSRDICPKPKWHFLARTFSIWVVFGVALFLGSVAVAVIIFAFVNADIGLYRLVGRGPVMGILKTVPILWLSSFVILLAVAEYAVTNTKRGYKYTVAQVGLVNIFVSVILGGVLYSVGFGYAVDRELSERVQAYRPILEDQLSFLIQPERGLLAGEVILVTTTEAYHFQLRDFSGKDWYVRQIGLDNSQLVSVVPRAQVQIIGELEGLDLFGACSVKPLIVHGKMFFKRVSPLNASSGRIEAQVQQRGERKSVQIRSNECEELHTEINNN